MKKIVLVLLLMVAMTGCRGLTPEAESAIRDSISINKGHMEDEGLPVEAREIATDNHDMGWAVLYHQGVEEELPSDVRERKAARDAARKAAGGGK